MTVAYQSIFGRRLGLTPNGLMVDNRMIGTGPVGMGKGNTWYVNSAVAGADGSSPFTAMATLDEAFAKCVANQGDVIVVMPGHAETITSAGAIAHDVAGVSVIGLGYGESRPTITLGTANTTTYAITAASAYIENIVFVANFLNIAACITTTKKGTHINNCSFRDTSSILNMLTPIKATSTTNNDSDRLVVENCRWMSTASGALEMIEINANIDGFRCWNNTQITAGTASPMILVATGKILTGAEIGWNKCVNAMTANELFISNDGTTNTGIIHNNFVGHADVTGTHDAGWDGGGFRLWNNASTSVDNLSGFVVPAIDVNL